MSQQVSTVLLRGGLNLVTPAIATPPGGCIAAQNYDPEVRGYRRTPGYERFDGRPRPSEAEYAVLPFSAGLTAIEAGSTITGATSNAVAIVLEDAIVESGAWGSGDATGAIVVYGLTGVFQTGEDIEVASAKVAEATGAATINGASNDTDAKAWFRAAVAATRVPISKVPGSGPVRGVWTFDGAVWAFRDNDDATACAMFKSSEDGWVEQDLGHTLEFDAGADPFEEGETLTQGGVTGIIRRVVDVEGAYATDDAEGYLTVTNIVGGSFTTGTATTDAGSANITGVEIANVLPAGGRYSFTNYNFYGSAARERMYGANGVGNAFMWDGEYFTEIRTGLDDDEEKPSHIAEFSNHLFLAYQSGSVTFSGVGEPLSYAPIDGAGNFSFGAPVTDMLQSASSALIIFGRSRVSYLYGNDAQNFVLEQLADDAGAVAYTAQNVGSPLYMDEAGVRRMSTTEAFGNWRMGTITQAITPWFQAKQKQGITAVGSIRIRELDQYKVFMSDGSGITLYLGRKTPEAMPFQLPFVLSCAVAGPYDGNAGEEQLFVGTEDGFVYQLAAGTSFDGNEVQAFILLPFNAVGSTQARKRFHKAAIECDAGPDTQISVTAEFEYGSPDLPAATEQSFDVSGGGGFWNVSNWNQVVWSSTYQGIAEAYIPGIGRNVAIGILSDATHEAQHTLSSLTLNFTYRGLVR